MTPREQAAHNGEKTFYNGLPCPQGHRVLRYTANGTCVVCSRAAAARRNLPENKTKRQEDWRRRQYGVTPGLYLRLYASTNGKCPVCLEAFEVNTSRGNKAKAACIDHCHISGKVRGLLCNLCNSGIGKLGDSVANLRRGADYLDGHA